MQAITYLAPALLLSSVTFANASKMPLEIETIKVQAAAGSPLTRA